MGWQMGRKNKTFHWWTLSDLTSKRESTMMEPQTGIVNLTYDLL